MTPENVNLVIAYAVPIAATVVSGLAATGIFLLQKKVGMTQAANDMLYDKNMRDKLQNTLVTAVGMYNTGDKLRALNYVMHEATDAVDHFVLTEPKVNELIAAKAAAWSGGKTSG